MFGTFRYVLALLVAFGHLHFRFQDQWNWTGLYAVFGFFLLSGFLMTRVLHRTYGYGARGFAAYLANRALRIYPAYWAALGLSILALLWAPDFPGNAGSVEHLPGSAVEYLLNFLIVGVDRDYTPRVVPTAWSLHVELCFYFLIGVGLSRTRWTTAIWILSAVGWTGWAVMHGTGFADRYSTVVAASLPFALGAGLHFLRWSPPRWALFAACASFAVNALAAPLLWGDPHSSIAFYLSLVLVWTVVAGLRDIRPRGRWAQWDRRLGDLSYPIFLVHSQVGYLLGWLHWADVGTLRLFLISLPVLHLVAAAIHHAVVAPVENWRTRIRSRISESRTGTQRAGLDERSRDRRSRARSSGGGLTARRTGVRVAALALAVSTGLLVAGVAGEGVLRLRGRLVPSPPPSPPQVDGYGLPIVEGLFALAVPNQRSNYRGALYETNSRGLRGPEIVMPKPADVFRVGFLGDSYTMGSGVRYEEAFPERTTSSLGRTPDGRHLEAVNLGLAGLALTGIVELRLPMALDVDPDLLVYGWNVNDLEGPNYRYTYDARERSPNFSPTGRSLLLDLLRRRWEYLRDIFWPSSTSYLGELDENYFDNPAAWAEFERDLDQLADAARSRGICAVTFILPEMQVLSPLHPYARYYEAVAAAARKRGLFVVDGFPPFLGEDVEALRCSPLDWHPNAKAHAILGEALVQGLRALPASCWSRRSGVATGPSS